MEENLLPHSAKKIALSAAILSIAGFAFSSSVASHLPLEESSIEWIFKDLILISFLCIIFSGEKLETGRTKKLRVQEMVNTIKFGGMVLVFDSLSVIFYSDDTSLKMGYELMLVLLAYYWVVFNIRKRVRQPAGTRA